MNRFFKLGFLLLAFLCTSYQAAQAQYYSIINQASGMLQTALNGGFRYRGFVDASYTRGIGDHRANILEFTTSQGVKYADWFYMGLGAGVDVMMADAGNPLQNVQNGKGLTETACMIPLFTDFRFNIGPQNAVSFFIDARVGASFLIGKNYVQIGDGYITRSECFYLRPSVGLRIPVSKANQKQAVNVGCCYNLITTEGWWGYDDNITLNSLGVIIGFEW